MKLNFIVLGALVSCVVGAAPVSYADAPTQAVYRLRGDLFYHGEKICAFDTRVEDAEFYQVCSARIDTEMIQVRLRLHELESTDPSVRQAQIESQFEIPQPDGKIKMVSNAKMVTLINEDASMSMCEVGPNDECIRRTGMDIRWSD